ncbi:MAG TPA: BON domain-containing protein [Roseiflexaceae bacterium]|nr:BON domain-containing protein [Roseiflexaceae bacterium]
MTDRYDDDHVTQPDDVEVNANMGTLSGFPDQGNVPHIEPTDSWIHQEALTLLKHDPLIEHDGLQVSVTDGVVTLRGVVRHPNERAAAEDRIKLLAGVKRVQNELKIGPPLKKEE